MQLGKKATAFDVREALKTGHDVDVYLAKPDDINSYAIAAAFDFDGELYVYMGKRFTAESKTEAEAEFERKKIRLLQGKTPNSKKYSLRYREAKASFEAKIKKILEIQTPEKALIQTTRITINKKRQEPILITRKGTTISDIKSMYDPEYSDYLKALQEELK